MTLRIIIYIGEIISSSERLLHGDLMAFKYDSIIMY